MAAANQVIKGQSCHKTQLMHIQWNPVNTGTNEPWKFGCINGVGSNFITGLLQVTS